MANNPPMPPTDILSALKDGMVIPAHPLALNNAGKFDEQRMALLTRYYIDSGAGGVAIGVHTTQFEIRNPGIDLYKPVLENVAGTVNSWEARKPVVLIAGICGDTRQAADEAETATELGYHAGLLSLSALIDASDDALIDHCRAVGEVIPLFGFYLQPAVGGRKLSFDFWRRFSLIENVIAIKVAPFDRYETINVARAVTASGRASEIALYTGNDDNIVADLFTPFTFGDTTIRFAGGLLGQWAVWTKSAVDLFNEIRDIVNPGCIEPGCIEPGSIEPGCIGTPLSRYHQTNPAFRHKGVPKQHIEADSPIPGHLLTIANQLTDANAAIFDARNNFAGCIPGIHEILRRQGLFENRCCLDSNLDLSPGQADEIDRVCHAYPHLTDDDFISQHLDKWLK